MRRFFSFRSSASSSGNSSKVIHDGFESPEKEENEPRKLDPECADSAKSRLRRSLSFSYPATYCGPGDENLSSGRDKGVSPSSPGSSPHGAVECPILCHSLTPERCTGTKRGDRIAARKVRTVEMLDSPNSSKGYQCSSGNSPYSSPIPLKCRNACLSQISSRNQILDLYIDGEHQEIKSKKDYRQHSFESGCDDCLVENRTVPSLGRPPRAQSTAPSSPTYSKENYRSCSFREVKDIRGRLSRREWSRDDHQPVRSQIYTRKNVENLSRSFSGGCMIKPEEGDSETTTTIEDIYEDSSYPLRTLNSNSIAEDHSSDLNPSISGHCAEEVLGFRRQSCVLGNEWTASKSDKPISSRQQEHDRDEELLRKAKEVEARLALLSEEDHELNGLRNNTLNVSAFLQMIRDITEDRRYLAYELSSQINSRLTERSSTKEQLKQAKVELDTRTRRLEKEKIELQSSLEKELDRRSSDWSLKLEKFQAEEQRLRERVRELAEQNVSLQREVSSLKGYEADSRSRITNAEFEVNALTYTLEEVKKENCSLHHALSELQNHFNGAEEDLDSVRRSYKEKDKENKDLQKVVVRLQRVCSEQDKTICGLRQGYTDEIGRHSFEKTDNLTCLQLEQLRLTGVEQTLRKEIESCRHELDTLRHENICLLDRLRSDQNSNGLSSMKLDQELHARVICLQKQSLSLLDENSHLCGELLCFFKRKQCNYVQESNSESNGFSLVDYSVKHQNLNRGIENFRRSLLTVSKLLDEKSSLEEPDHQPRTTEEKNASRQLKDQAFENEMELELKAESILTRVLREKLCSKELELEQLQADFASSVRSHDVLQNEIQRLQDELSCLTHKTKHMELQMLRADEAKNQFQNDLQVCMKELTSTRGVLLKVSEERDRLWEEVKRSRETIILLKHEVDSLKKKIEVLDEDVLIKEGEITILKDSLSDKPFDIVYSPTSVKEFSLE